MHIFGFKSSERCVDFVEEVTVVEKVDFVGGDRCLDADQKASRSLCKAFKMMVVWVTLEIPKKCDREHSRGILEGIGVNCRKLVWDEIGGDEVIKWGGAPW